ncbi:MULTISPECIES: sensor histidine kinase [Thioalkalivibrio]|uniref:histidine kinase n=1 Tax=Thioalkalivibrio halophilus TaxID=252474 RepID=A0A1V3A1D1_9GAMM|nr:MULTISPECIES: ATP-binding protein [Thioalkalivibrio]OOC11152.1 two-component sensor histidine kinase [Thioalkalivibrio halophilus]
MVARLKSLPWGLLGMILLFVLLLASLLVMGDAAQHQARFEQLFIWLLVFHAGVLIVLAGLIIYQVVRMFWQYRHGVPGSRLTLRLVGGFMLVAVLPVSVVYYFSYEFLSEGVDSWFDVRVDSALEDALELSRSSLDLRVRQLAEETQEIMEDLEGVSEGLMGLTLNDYRRSLGAQELTLVGANNRIIASSTDSPIRQLPSPPSSDILMRVRPGQPYSRLEPRPDDQLVIRVVATTASRRPGTDNRILQAVYPVDPRMSALSLRVQDAFADYREFAYLRGPITQGFIFTMSLALAISLMAALWAGLVVARRLVQPVSDLVQGTRMVAAGDYNTRLEVRRADELGFLVQSFNAMTRTLSEARNEAERNRRLLDAERAYLESVLKHLRSGVLALDGSLRLRTANDAAGQILECDLPGARTRDIAEVGRECPLVHQFFEAIRDPLAGHEAEWSRQVVVFTRSGRKVLMTRAVWLPTPGSGRGLHAIVFDDMTEFLKAQRDAAWGEVARRLAHEIKNPLTPIQLSAERLSRRLGRVLEGADHEVLERATGTIIQQVEAMKTLVNAFRDYAQAPKLELGHTDVNQLVRDVSELYLGADGSSRVHLDLGEGMPLIRADGGRLRQLLHNLVRNAMEAAEEQERGDDLEVYVSTDHVESASGNWIELRVRDNGPGIRPELLERIFEPYTTHKPRGTGLGLAVAQKIVEEHGGIIECHNDDSGAGGAVFVIRIPVDEGGPSGASAAEEEQPQ